MAPGQTVDVDLMDTKEGDTVELDKVLLIADDLKVTVGTPVIEGARVMANWHSDGRSPKLIVFKYKAKTRYHRKYGHHQLYTKLTIDKILLPGEKLETPKPTRARRTKKETVKETPETPKEVTTDGA